MNWKPIFFFFLTLPRLRVIGTVVGLADDFLASSCCFNKLLRLVVILAAMDGEVGKPSFKFSVRDIRLVDKTSIGVFFFSPILPLLVLLVLRLSVFN